MMDEAKYLFEQGQALLTEAARTGDILTAMRGRALCHRAIEMRWYNHIEGNLLDPPWVKRTIVKVGGIQHPAPGPNLGGSDPGYLEWLNQDVGRPAAEPQQVQLSLFPGQTQRRGEYAALRIKGCDLGVHHIDRPSRL